MCQVCSKWGLSFLANTLGAGWGNRAAGNKAESQSLHSSDRRQIFCLYVPPAPIIQYATNWTHHFLIRFALPPIDGTTLFTLPQKSHFGDVPSSLPPTSKSIAKFCWQSLQWLHSQSFLLLPTISAVVQSSSALAYCRDCSLSCVRIPKATPRFKFPRRIHSTQHILLFVAKVYCSERI